MFKIYLKADYYTGHSFIIACFLYVCSPNNRVRQEAMTMYARAMDITGLEEINNNKIETYADKEEIAAWAYEFVKKTVSVGVFNGRTSETIDPKETFTYAEAATAIKNLLVKAQLINE